MSEKPITPGPASVVRPESDSALQAAYKRLELSRFLTLEQAMSEPAYASVIRSLADAIRRRDSAERMAEACANDKLKYRLQFTQDFRDEVRVAIAAREQGAIDAP
jgi:hypothetical protein